MAEDQPHKYAQLTEDQIDIWMALPQTQYFLRALMWRAEDVQDALGTGKLLDSSNADLSHAQSHGALGQQDAYRFAADARRVFDHYELVFHPPPPETEEEEEESEPDSGE